MASRSRCRGEETKEKAIPRPLRSGDGDGRVGRRVREQEMEGRKVVVIYDGD